MPQNNNMAGAPGMPGAPGAMGGRPAMPGAPGIGGAPGMNGAPGAMGGRPGMSGAPGMGGAPGMNGMPGLGGLAGTLKRLTSYYRFEPEYQEVVATRQDAADTMPSDSYLKVTGEAKTRFWDRVMYNLNFMSDSIPDYVMENLPSAVEIYFRMVDSRGGQRRPFPCKIAYFTGARSGKKESRNLLFTVEYTSVVRDDPTINPDDFIYVQPQITFDRLNAEYISELTESPADAF